MHAYNLSTLFDVVAIFFFPISGFRITTTTTCVVNSIKYYLYDRIIQNARVYIFTFAPIFDRLCIEYDFLIVFARKETKKDT